ncbi:MAG: DUF1007 family protein [Hyphomicrobiales bacterium]|nr:DUF1007 family protein [Hyphomicrobiales bacterium]
MRARRAILAALALCAGAAPALAHPHILVSARTKLLFDAQGRLAAVRNVWTFDKAFSAYAIQGYDSKGDGMPTREELAPLATLNVTSLATYHWFTTVEIGGKKATLEAPKDYSDEFAGEALTLRFTLPLKAPVAVKGAVIDLAVFDAEYFAAVTFAADAPVSLVGAAPACRIDVIRPRPLDATMAGTLAKIPASVRELPPDLFSVTKLLVNAAHLDCR